MVKVTVFGNTVSNCCTNSCAKELELENIVYSYREYLQKLFPGMIDMTYIDFLSGEMNAFPAIKKQIFKRELKLPLVVVNGKIQQQEKFDLKSLEFFIREIINTCS